jgi:cell division protein FtsQ
VNGSSSTTRVISKEALLQALSTRGVATAFEDVPMHRHAVRPAISSAPPERTTVWGWLLTAVGLVVVMAMGWWVTNSPLFDMRTLQVSGNARLTPEAVARLAGLTQDTNVLWFSTGAIEERLEATPWIRDASVSRTLPHTITVSVAERSPVAMVTSEGTRMLVASDGTVLGKAGRSADLPRVDVAGIPNRPGARVALTAPVLLVASTLAPQLVERVASVEVDDDGLVFLRLKDGPVAIYGETDRVREKSAAVLAVVEWADREGVALERIDVRAPTAPAVVPLEPEEGSSSQGSAS